MKYRKMYATWLYLLAMALMIRYFSFEMNPNYNMELYERFLFLVFSCVISYCGSCLLAKGRSKKKRCIIMRCTFFVYFIMYLMLLMTLTLFDPMMGRTVKEPWSMHTMMQYAKATANLQPFRMIQIYWYGYVHEQITWSQFLMNMAGNVILLMPMAFFLPIFMPSTRLWHCFFARCLMVCLFIECSQMITMCGYFDVDDIMLNMAGAMLMYGILRIPFVYRHYVLYLKR